MQFITDIQISAMMEILTDEKNDLQSEYKATVLSNREQRLNLRRQKWKVEEQVTGLLHKMDRTLFEIQVW